MNKRLFRGLFLLAAIVGILLLVRQEKNGATKGQIAWNKIEIMEDAAWAELKLTHALLQSQIDEEGNVVEPETGLASVALTWQGERLPDDRRTGHFMLPLGLEPADTYCAWEGTDTHLARRIVKGEDNAEQLIVYNDTQYQVYSFWKTTLPVLLLHTGEKTVDQTKREAEPITAEKDTEVAMTVFDPDSLIQEIDHVTVDMHTRGASSHWIPKKSYRVKVKEQAQQEEQNSKRELYGKKYPFFQMRPAREWVLYSFYGDESKMREKLSRDLWDDMAQNSTYVDAGNGLQMEYCEVFLDGEYQGLYGMGTAVDRRNFWEEKSGERQDLLFKTVNFDAPTKEDIQAVEESGEESCKCLELKYASWKSQDMWESIGQYMHLAYYAPEEEYLEQMRDYMEVDDHIDYWLFFLASGLDDNELKNLYLSITDAKHNTKVLLTPWDMDMSWGVGYTGEDIFMWGRSDVQYKKIMDFPIVSRMFSAGDKAFIEQTKKRWKSLREDIISEEKMLERVEAYDTLLWKSDIMAREMERWPEAKYAADTEYLSNYIEKRFVYLDDYMEQLGEGEWDDGWN